MVRFETYDVDAVVAQRKQAGTFHVESDVFHVGLRVPAPPVGAIVAHGATVVPAVELVPERGCVKESRARVGDTCRRTCYSP